ncbi:hypothetical protein A3D05_00105 [Candidatus Gottesmanbacteria bacterium RIFCSPHIGHO2_02_FULL_40_24]|nr:MAG: hypothetical protein A3D05_00105 [Candidatus Gottesmanbacteria bacterium RIFCSPHIGHO2_02_FULL_40_24]OGG21868.1 MAG: hypothetical protein A3B48_04035 [Candidatus Gottesmanbacteria bacterium RIFCSPLOWO2_01_FULL_40_10]OGG25500.1 MAG: hypothetical protein A3E42_03575 [Candidatus Gottesmanbacteria bacterium RIFCSPHIGHO2_12_FULL_40_13]OGG33158.1 MAG: hypothetical protein A3I80_01585 [Candidatus Gottesmanbacteria bacterium RIFCSPLOWO2_02_FULL_40_10]
MSIKFKKLLGVKISITTKENILEEVRKYLKQLPNSNFQSAKKEPKPLVIFTPNPEIITFAQKYPLFKRIVNSSQINIADGSGIVWAMKKEWGIKINTIPGVDLMSELVKLSEKNVFRIGLIGGRGGLAVKTAECLRQLYPKLKISVFVEPEINLSNDKLKLSIYSDKKEADSRIYMRNLAKEILRKKVDMLFVALGFPKQEIFIDRLRYYTGNSPLVIMGVGGSFDYITGNARRAPLFLRVRGQEWLFRLVNQPWRINRQITGSQFFLQIILKGTTQGFLRK